MNTDGRTGRRLRESMQVRLTARQAEAMHGRADRTGESASEALRSLLELAIPMDAAEARGLVVAPDVLRADGPLALAWVWDLSDAQVDALVGIEPEAAARLRDGAVLLTTPESAMALQEPADG